MIMGPEPMIRTVLMELSLGILKIDLKDLAGFSVDFHAVFKLRQGKNRAKVRYEAENSGINFRNTDIKMMIPALTGKTFLYKTQTIRL